MKTSFIAQKPDPAARADDYEPELHRAITSVALIGPDGAGKTAVAKALVESCPLPLKYIYMGTSIESSNVTLPTSRLVHRWKVYQHRRSLRQSGKDCPQEVTLHGLEHRVDRRGKLGACLRLVRRLTEEAYRQCVAWIYQRRGQIVLFDRHFLFDACPPPGGGGDHRLTDRMHYWFLRRLCPPPKLVILLDAPPEILFARKQEVPIEHLQLERDDLAKKSSYAETFLRVDATLPLDQVVDEVNELLVKYCYRGDSSDTGLNRVAIQKMT